MITYRILARWRKKSNPVRHGLLTNGCAPALTHWLIAHPQLRPSWSKQFALRYGSFWFEHLRIEQDKLAISSRPLRPEFIMGFWRSGTTLLHNLIYAASQSQAPLSWECFNPSSFRLRPPPKVSVSINRPMDQGVISTFGPQEDEFAIMLLGEPSLYRAFFHPSRFAELVEETIASADTDHPRWSQFLHLVQANDDIPLVLKSPNHWLRTPMLGRTFPTARQVWVGRNFAETYVSNINMWTTMARLHALSNWSSAHIADGVFKLTIAYRDKLDALIANRSVGILWLDFNQLSNMAVEHSRQAASFLGLSEPSGDQRKIKVADTRVHTHARSTFDQIELPAAIKLLIGEINDLQNQALRRWGAA
jgi:Sulfotransferase family